MIINQDVLKAIKIVRAESLAAGTVVIYTPADSATRFVITDIEVMMDGANNGTVTIYEDSNALANLIYRHTYASAQGAVSHHRPYKLPLVCRSGKAIKIDNPSGVQTRIILHGYEAY